jgi:hypothetical protein
MQIEYKKRHRDGEDTIKEKFKPGAADYWGTCLVVGLHGLPAMGFGKQNSRPAHALDCGAAISFSADVLAGRALQLASVIAVPQIVANIEAEIHKE